MSIAIPVHTAVPQLSAATRQLLAKAGSEIGYEPSRFDEAPWWKFVPVIGYILHERAMSYLLRNELIVESVADSGYPIFDITTKGRQVLGANK